MSKSKYFQDIILNLKQFWADKGCLIWSPHHETVGAGTGNPATFLRVLGPEPWSVAYEEPSFRADDGRYAENPNRMQMHHQFQVILKPPPAEPTELYLQSLEAVGFDLSQHDIRFVEDNWESPALGAWGLGWEVWLDGMEITQFTYFQQCGGIVLDTPACEITYGLERLAMYLQEVESAWDLQWNAAVRYDQILKAQEIEYCRYNFELADTNSLRKLYELYDAEAQSLIEKGAPIPAYDFILRCSQTFNVLDARGAVGVAERVKLFGRMRSLCRRVATAFIASREAAGFPLLPSSAVAQKNNEQVGLQSQSVTKASSFVFELGCEELTADATPTIALRFQELFLAICKDQRLQCSEPQFFATPRRIGVFIESLQPNQIETTERVYGPQREICDKNPKALNGFCKRNNVSPEQVQFELKEGKESAFVDRTLSAGAVSDVLGGAIQNLLSEIRYEREMRWLAPEKNCRSFNRPVRWLVSLFGGQVIPVVAFGLKAGKETRAGRWMDSKRLFLQKAEDYLQVIKDAGIEIFPEARHKKIVEALQNRSKELDCELPEYPALIDEISFLVESPNVFIGSFDESFTRLPSCVLDSVIRKHVRCFPLYKNGNIRNVFLGVSNGADGERLKIVSSGFERVIRARFMDAQFFIEKDQQSSLSEFQEKLATLTFHDKIGSYREKVARLSTLIPFFTTKLALSEDQTVVLRRSFELSKFDLVTQMVAEMTSLAGKMGAIYAKHFGEDEEVCDSLEEQYYPGYRGDRLPEQLIAKCLSIADKFDSVCTLLAVGQEPTGSADPFAIRREAHGVIANACSLPVSFDLMELFDVLKKSFQFSTSLSQDELQEKVQQFFSRRLEIFLSEEGFSSDVIRSVIGVHARNPKQALHFAREVVEVIQKQELRTGFAVHKRCHRIFLQAQSKNERIAEITTCTAVKSLEDIDLKVLKALEPFFKAEYHSLGSVLSDLSIQADLIEQWFESVMIMSEDLTIRAVRLGVTKEIVRIVSQFAHIEELDGARFE